jgi:S1-C subfamily serine protease
MKLNRRYGMKRILPLVVAAVIAGGVAGAAVEAALGDSSGSTASASTVASSTRSPAVSPRPASASGVLTAEQLYRRGAPGVVVITATATQTVPGTFFTPPTREQVSSLGSGFVIDTKGDIVTNDHVVKGSTGIRVGFSGTTTYPAKVVGTDPSTDLAVVRVDAPASALHPLALGDSGRIQVGDPVYAIGNPFGLDRTLTAGIVSATGRDIQSPNGISIGHAIQTDAAINHGNSGGPLLDRFGRVIGVNAQIENGSSGGGNVGVGFAIPSNTVRAIAPQLLAHGHAQHAWLGVSVQTVDPSVAAVAKGVPAHGVLVEKVVKGSPAAKAGLEAGTRQLTVNGESALVGGDAIVSVDGQQVASGGELADAVSAKRPGDHVTLGVARNGARRSVVVTLGNAPTAA